MLSYAAIRAAMTHPVYRWAILWQYPVEGGTGFFDALLRAIAKADHVNAELLRLGFPEQVEAVKRWQNDPGFAQEVERWAEEHARG